MRKIYYFLTNTQDVHMHTAQESCTASLLFFSSLNTSLSLSLYKEVHKCSFLSLLCTLYLANTILVLLFTSSSGFLNKQMSSCFWWGLLSSFTLLLGAPVMLKMERSIWFSFLMGVLFLVNFVGCGWSQENADSATAAVYIVTLKKAPISHFYGELRVKNQHHSTNGRVTRLDIPRY